MEGGGRSCGFRVEESCVWHRPDGAASQPPGDPVSWEKKSRCPPKARPTSERAPWARGRRPLLRRGLCRWPSRRRNMASKVSPSCRLVFCLLISAAVLRPGKLLASEQSPPLWRTGGGSLGALGLCALACAYQSMGAIKARGDTDLSLGTVTCVTRFRLDWSAQVWAARLKTEHVSRNFG